MDRRSMYAGTHELDERRLLGIDYNGYRLDTWAVQYNHKTVQ
jgi:hypothetical protein